MFDSTIFSSDQLKKIWLNILICRDYLCQICRIAFRLFLCIEHKRTKLYSSSHRTIFFNIIFSESKFSLKVQNTARKCGCFSTKHFQVHFATHYHIFETSAFEGTFFQLNIHLYSYMTQIYRRILLTFVLSLYTILFPVIHTFQQSASLAIQ